MHHCYLFSDEAGVKVPDKPLVTGLAGKAKGEVTQQQLLRTQLGSQAYIELAKQYKKEES